MDRDVYAKLVAKLKEVREIITGLEEDSGTISELETAVSGLQTDVGGLQTDVGGLQTDVGGLQTAVGGLQNVALKSKTVNVSTGNTFGEAEISDSDVNKIICAYVPSKANWFCRCYYDKRIQILDITDNSFKTSQSDLPVTIYYI